MEMMSEERKSELTHVPGLDWMATRYESLRHQPCRVTAQMRQGTPVCAYDEVHLDNLLARCVVDEVTGGAGLVTPPRPYALPTPLYCLWRDPWGLPLWASTVFQPEAEQCEDTIYFHKRAQSGRFTRTKSGKHSVVTKSGRFMERRIPTPVTISKTWSAFCVGNVTEIRRLLASVSFLGKKRSVGWGEVVQWVIEPLPLPEDFAPEGLLVHEKVLTRPLPAGAVGLLGGNIPQGAMSLVGWTPPQWSSRTFQAGWRVGTQVG